MAMIALPPFVSASSIMRCITCSRLSIRAFVMPFSSPPRIDLKLAPVCEPMLRDRTVRPITSPSTSTISWPGSSLVVLTNTSHHLLRFALQNLPGVADIIFRRTQVADREPQDVAAAELRVRDEELAGLVDAPEERLVRLVGGIEPDADER